MEWCWFLAPAVLSKSTVTSDYKKNCTASVLCCAKIVDGRLSSRIELKIIIIMKRINYDPLSTVIYICRPMYSPSGSTEITTTSRLWKLIPISTSARPMLERSKECNKWRSDPMPKKVLSSASVCSSSN